MERSQRLLVLAIAQVLLGSLIGLIPPTAVQHFRSIVTAHIEYCVNGMLLAIVALLLPRMFLNRYLTNVLEFTAVLGTFSNGTAFLISAFTGFGTKLSVTVNEKFPYPKGIQGVYSDIMTMTLMMCAVCTITFLLLTIVGLLSYAPIKRGKET